MHLVASLPPDPCIFMAALIDLLGEMPEPQERRRVDVFAQRLDKLEVEARQRAAPEATMAAIRGARVLLELAELPPVPPARKPGVAR